MTPTLDRPVTSNVRGIYRVNVLCHTCHRPQVFRYRNGWWYCEECGQIERDARGGLAADPWVVGQ